MSILIKGMEMPKSCEDCSIKSWDCEGYVCPFSGIDTLNVGRQRDCPLVPVPPHGDLIDSRVAYDKIAEQEGGNYVDMDAVGKGLEATPVIIPAEEGE